MKTIKNILKIASYLTIVGAIGPGCKSDEVLGKKRGGFKATTQI